MHAHHYLTFVTHRDPIDHVHSLVFETLFPGRIFLLTLPLVVRAHGFQHVRAEKSWRPIVTVTVGDYQYHELNLGCDGQNPDLRECFRL